MAHQVQIKELINGIEITENLDGVISVALLSYNSKPFLRTTNETDEESYQVLDTLGEIYHLPALATEFILIDLENNYWQPDNGTELIEYSYKIRAFRPENEFDRVLSIGSIETTSNSVTVNIPGVGLAISLLMNGSIYSRYYPFIANYTPIVGTSGEQKILIVYGKPDSQVLYLAQGAEALEAVEPSYDGLFVARIIVSAEGQTVETERFDLKYITSDGWRQITINTIDPATIYMAGNLASSFDINSNVLDPVIGLISAKAGRPFWDGSEFWIKNSSAYDLTLEPKALADVGIYQTITFAETTIVKPGIWVKIKIKNGVLEVAKLTEDINLSPYATVVNLIAETTARIAGDAVEIAVIVLSPTDEDLTDNIARKGFVATFPFQITNFQTTAYPVPTGSGITTQLRKNGTAVTTTHSVIPASSNNSTGSSAPVFSSDTFAIGDRLDFFTPSGGIGSTIKGQNLKATLTLKKL